MSAYRSTTSDAQRNRLTHAELLRVLRYSRKTGTFTWRVRSDVSARWNTRYAGKIAGSDWKVGKDTYRVIRIFDYPNLGHQLAVFYVTGKWPQNLVDHKDRNGLNNRWKNLREATKAQNAHNMARPKTNTSGFKGVSFSKENRRFRAYIKVDGTQKWLGYHDTAEAAHAAYCAAAKKLRGEFARAA